MPSSMKSELANTLGRLIKVLGDHYRPIYIPPVNIGELTWEFRRDDLSLLCLAGISYAFDTLAYTKMELYRCHSTRCLLYFHVDGVWSESEDVEEYVTEITESLRFTRRSRSGLRLVLDTLPVVIDKMERIYQKRLSTHEFLLTRCRHIVDYVENCALVGMQMVPEPDCRFLKIPPAETMYYALAYALFRRTQNIEGFRGGYYEFYCVDMDLGIMDTEHERPPRITPIGCRYCMVFRFHKRTLSSRQEVLCVPVHNDDEWQLATVAEKVPYIMSHLHYDYDAMSQLVYDLVTGGVTGDGSIY